jgi:hypothetical protein
MTIKDRNIEIANVRAIEESKNENGGAWEEVHYATGAAV